MSPPRRPTGSRTRRRRIPEASRHERGREVGGAPRHHDMNADAKAESPEAPDMIARRRPRDEPRVPGVRFAQALRPPFGTPVKWMAGFVPRHDRGREGGGAPTGRRGRDDGLSLSLSMRPTGRRRRRGHAPVRTTGRRTHPGTDDRIIDAKAVYPCASRRPWRAHGLS